MSRQDTTAGDEGSASHQMRQDQKSPGEPAWDGWLAELQSAEAELANRLASLIMPLEPDGPERMWVWVREAGRCLNRLSEVQRSRPGGNLGNQIDCVRRLRQAADDQRLPLLFRLIAKLILGAASGDQDPDPMIRLELEKQPWKDPRWRHWLEVLCNELPVSTDSSERTPNWATPTEWRFGPTKTVIDALWGPPKRTGGSSDDLQQLMPFAEKELKRNERRILLELIKKEGALALKDLACLIGWTSPWDDCFQKAANRLNKKLRPKGWKLLRFNSEARLEKLARRASIGPGTEKEKTA